MTYELGPLRNIGLGDLIQIADPDALSNPANLEMEMEKQLVQREVRLGSASYFESILTVSELRSSAGTIELKFETDLAVRAIPKSASSVKK